MDRKIRYIWWAVLGIFVIGAAWKLCLPHGNKVVVNSRAATAVREIVVYVSGAVEKPGLIHLPLDARLDDALKQANPLSGANLEVLNLAEKLKDGQKISIPYKQEITEENQAEPGQTGAAGSGTAGTASNGTATERVSAGKGGTGSGRKVNINTAGVSELDALPGVGPVLAQRIIQYREEHGLFVKPEDLQEVAGIGTKTYEKMADQVSVGP